LGKGTGNLKGFKGVKKKKKVLKKKKKKGGLKKKPGKT
jgi:hypothetical protein